jgi:hypothetical protein
MPGGFAARMDAPAPDGSASAEAQRKRLCGLKHPNTAVISAVQDSALLMESGAKTGSKDNVQPTKLHRGRSAKRIDGISAIVTALARATLYAEHESVYEKRGIIIF